MSSSFLDSENVTSDSTLLKGHRQARGSSQQYYSNKLTSASESRQVSSLAFLPILGLIIFLICSFLKVYKWSKDDARWKARGDVEFGDEAEVNYGIIHVGDKDFCPIDIRSDGASVYDTVNSFRFLGNGYATQISETYAYHDTVTSYKSLLMQRADGSQYDSIKSYKAFLQKVAQNKDLAVNVKLLENYPVHSKSTDHCVALEGDTCRKSEIVASRMQSALPLIENLHKDSQLHHSVKRKSKHRRSSGEVPTATRKRSLPNPSSRRINGPACSMPSIRHTFSFSGDSVEGARGSFRASRDNNGKNRPTISHSSSGGKMSKVSGIIAQSTVERHSGGSCKRRRRHYSADSVQRLQRVAGTVNKTICKCRNNELVLNDSLKTATEVKTMAETEPSFNLKRDESSSENPNSLHSSDTDVPSETLTIESDIDTKKSLPLSTLSDGKTLDNDVFFSFNSTGELPLSLQVFQSSPKLPSSGTKMFLAHARTKFFNNKLNNEFSILSPGLLVSCPPSVFTSNQNSNDLLENNISPVDLVQISGLENHSISAEEITGLDYATELSVPTNSQQLVMADTLEVGNSPARRLQSPHKVQHFHVTIVSAKISTLNPN